MSAGSLKIRLAAMEAALNPSVSQLGDSKFRRLVIEGLGDRWPVLETQIAQCAELGVEWVPGPGESDLLPFINAEIREVRKQKAVEEMLPHETLRRSRIRMRCSNSTAAVYWSSRANPIGATPNQQEAALVRAIRDGVMVLKE